MKVKGEDQRSNDISIFDLDLRSRSQLKVKGQEVSCLCCIIGLINYHTVISNQNMKVKSQVTSLHFNFSICSFVIVKHSLGIVSGLVQNFKTFIQEAYVEAYTNNAIPN